ncbi:PREDICTED: uncharacterized protein C14orf142 homolog [Chrysochloris asiatica]|uniref:Uncharacterized protein C14orf142 homolog n=1 Tax=Chrysochloris asiatica TaxID=185453 RepID=A0A9B0T7A4_CHRAS|nr:PREDICTED: uncharacterized protein C14orf142 homolog [Chrysochloris asiatica]
MELLAEFVGWDGQRHQLRVSCEAPNDADPLQGLLSGVAELRERLSELFGAVEQQEAQDPVAAVAAGGELLNGDAEDAAEDENNPNSDGPSAKRPKPPT